MSQVKVYVTDRQTDEWVWVSSAFVKGGGQKLSTEECLKCKQDMSTISNVDSLMMLLHLATMAVNQYSTFDVSSKNLRCNLSRTYIMFIHSLQPACICHNSLIPGIAAATAAGPTAVTARYCQRQNSLHSGLYRDYFLRCRSVVMMLHVYLVTLAA